MSLGTVSNFPSGMLPKVEKDAPRYGKQVAQAILSATRDQREAFKKRLFENRKYAEGNQSIDEYLDELEIDGKNMYTNISYRPRPIAQKFKNVVVNGYLMKKEYPSVNATSKHIQERKERKKSDAEFRMEYGEVLGAVSQEAGVPLTDPSEFTPETKEQSDIYFSLNGKEKEELLMQDMVSFALRDNDIESIKASALDDQFVAQLHGYYNYIDENGRLIIDYIQPEDIIADNSRKEDFTDCEYKGRWIRMSVSEVRKRFALTPKQEEALFGCAKDANGFFGNPTQTLRWEDDYRRAESRPYDSYTIEIMHVWYRTSKVLSYVEGTDRYGRQVFDVSYDSPKSGIKSDGRKKVGVKYPQTAYEGFFTASANICLEWGEQKNILRKGEDKEELLSNFIFFMPYNKGRQLPKSLMSLMVDSIRTMDVAILKIKQVIAKATPDDYIIDIDSLNALDLGTGEELQPLDIMSIFNQTGRLYYKGTKEDGVTPNQIPVRANLNPLAEKIQTYINVYNTELANIRDYLGVNEFRDGSASSPRTGFRFMQAQAEASNTATWFLYRAYIKSTQELIKQIGIRIWDALNYGEVNKGYLKYLGKENIEFIQQRKDITASSYDIEFKLGMDEEAIANLNNDINICLTNGTLEIPDAILIREIDDPMIAAKMMSYVYEKRRKQKLQEQDLNQKNAANYTSQAGKAVEQAKQATVQLQIQADMAKEKSRGDNDQIGFLLKGAIDLITESFKTGTEIPPMYLPLIDLALQSASSKTEQSLKGTLQEAQAQDQQQAQQDILGQVQQALDSGEIDESQAQQILQENGIQ